MSNKTVPYVRVIPRDLFNESKISKCIGHLTLLIHNNNNPYNIQFEHDGDPFDIQLLDEGSLFIANIYFTIKDTSLFFKTTYNSKRPYPLICEYNNEDFDVFDDEGVYTDEFLDFCKQF